MGQREQQAPPNPVWVIRSAFTEWQNIAMGQHYHPCTPLLSQVYPGPMCCKPAWQIMSNGVRKMEKILLEVWWVMGEDKRNIKKYSFKRSTPYIWNRTRQRERFIVFMRLWLVSMDPNTRTGGLRPSLISGSGLLNFFFSCSLTCGRKKKKTPAGQL